MARETVYKAAPSNVPGGRVFASSFQFLTTGEDHLRIRSWCSVAGVTLAIQGRHVNIEGTIAPFGFRHSPTADRLVAESFAQLDSGAVLNLGVFVESGAVKRGECFVEIALVRGLTANAYFLGTLLQGYVATVGAIAWPGSPIEIPTEGNGVIKMLEIGTAGGVEINQAVPTNTLWRVISLSARLLSFASPGPLQPVLVLQTGTHLYMRSAQKQTQVAAEEKTYQWAPGMPLETVIFDGVGVAGLPVPTFVQAGDTVRTSTIGFTGVETWIEDRVVVEEWLRP